VCSSRQQCISSVMLTCQTHTCDCSDGVTVLVRVQELRDMALKRAGLTEADVAQQIQDRAAARQVPMRALQATPIVFKSLQQMPYRNLLAASDLGC
jgi:hypothetical protein